MWKRVQVFFSNKKSVMVLEVLGFIFVFYLLNIVNQANRLEVRQFVGLDIWYEYSQALDIGSGQNIYEKIVHYDLLTNQKFATLFPLYYYFLYLIALAGKFNFDAFIDIYRSTLYVAEMLGSIIIYLIFRREDKRGVGFLAATFFVFNRWIINNILTGKQDAISIAFLLLSLYLLSGASKKSKIWSFFFYGLSLSIKHIGIFLGPIFLLPLINKELNLKEFFRGVGMFLIPTILIGLPTIINNPLAFFYSMLFSFTREPSRLNTEFGYNELLVLYKVGVENNNVFFYLLPRLPLFIFSGVNVLFLWFKKISWQVYCLTGLFIFIAFNPVLFSQYFTWIAPFIFFPLLGASKKSPSRGKHKI